MTLYNELEKIKNLPLGERTRRERQLFSYLQKYPLFKDIFNGATSFTNELKKFDEPLYKKLIPWRKDKNRNQELRKLSQFVSGTSNFGSSGIIFPDNIISTSAWMTAAVFGTVSLLSYLFPHKSYASPEELEQTNHFLNFIFPLGISGLASAILGPLSNIQRFSKQPLEEARYNDKRLAKFKEFSKHFPEEFYNLSSLEKSIYENYFCKSGRADIKSPKRKLPRNRDYIFSKKSHLPREKPLKFSYNKI